MRSIFKLTNHSNKFFLSPRHYKYNLQREYSRSCTALTVPPVRVSPHSLFFFFLFLCILIAATKELKPSWGIASSPRRSRFSSISFPVSYHADGERISIARVFVLHDFISVHRPGKMHFPVALADFAVYLLLIEPRFTVSLPRQSPIATLFPSDGKRTIGRSRQDVVSFRRGIWNFRNHSRGNERRFLNAFLHNG